jgi:hypothetical protein
MRTRKCVLARRGASLAVLLALVLLSILPALGQSKARKPGPTVKLYPIGINHTIHVRLNQKLSSKNARIGDHFTTTVIDPIYSTGGVLLIPAGSTIAGHVTQVRKAERQGEPGYLGVAFNSVTLPNQYKRTINGSLTDLDAGKTTSDNEGGASAKKTSKRNLKFIGGGAAGGLVIGAIAGGGKGAAIGAGVGAAVGLAGALIKKGSEAEVKSGTEFGVILNQSVSLPAYKAAT